MPFSEACLAPKVYVNGLAKVSAALPGEWNEVWGIVDVHGNAAA